MERDEIMPILVVVLVFVAIGILLTLLNKYGPPLIDPTILKILNAVIIIATLIWLLKVSGIWAYLARVTI